MVPHRRSSEWERRVFRAGILGCSMAGLLIAMGWARFVVATVGAVFLAGAITLERRRLAPLVWASVAFTAPLQGVRVNRLLALSDVLLLLALLMILPEALRWRRRVVPAGLVFAFALLVGAGLVGTFWASDAGASLVNLIKIVLAAAGTVVAMSLWDPGEESLRRFAWLWLGGAFVSASWAVATPRSIVGRSPGLTTHPNHFGLMCVLAVGLALGLALSHVGRLRWFALVSVLLLTVGVGLSGSRSALLGLVVTLGLLSALTRSFRLLLGLGAATLIGAIVILGGVISVPESHALSRLAGGGGSELSDLDRKAEATKALASIADHPFTGEGFEFAQAAHSIYLQVLVVGGPVALIAFLAISGLVLRMGTRSIQAQQGSPTWPILAGLTAGYGGYLASGTFDNILWDRYLWTYIALLVVLAATPSGERSAGLARQAEAVPLARSGAPQS